MQKFLVYMMSSLVLGIPICGVAQAQSPWRMQASGTTASLRGIYAVSGQIAWAGGTNGTVLRTIDGGLHWQSCSIPPHAAKLDFRSVWAWDGDHAMAMSSGPGDQSRLYSTHDGCRSWWLVFSNPDRDGFWDAVQFDGVRFGAILGDPVRGSFALFTTYDGGDHWMRHTDPCLRTMDPRQGAFAASNQALAVLPIEDANSPPGPAADHQIWFGTSGGWLYGLVLAPLEWIAASDAGCTHTCVLTDTHRQTASASAGIFALAFSDSKDGVAVGGDYTHPLDSADTAAYTTDGIHWQPALHSPAGYRSAVAWNNGDGSWIAGGSTGSDISRDGGRTWQPLDHGNWNALSLPFAVGPDGRIGRLVSWGQLRAENEGPSGGIFPRKRN